MIKISKNKQGTPEWFNDRKMKLTGSNAQAIATNGKGLESYARKIVMEKYCNNEENYTNADMERGTELEPRAREEYEIQTLEEVKEVGFMENDKYKMTGVSLDGITEKGTIEIKCMNNFNHFNFILDRKIKSVWLWQMQMGLLISERDYCDFVAYNPNFEKSLIIVRVKKVLEKQEKLKIGIEKGIKLINEIEKKLNN